jgi:hypothetical protein
MYTSTKNTKIFYRLIQFCVFYFVGQPDTVSLNILAYFGLPPPLPCHTHRLISYFLPLCIYVCLRWPTWGVKIDRVRRGLPPSVGNIPIHQRLDIFPFFFFLLFSFFVRLFYIYWWTLEAHHSLSFVFFEKTKPMSTVVGYTFFCVWEGQGGLLRRRIRWQSSTHTYRIHFLSALKKKKATRTVREWVGGVYSSR